MNRPDHHRLRQAALLFAAGFGIHGVDHVIRGFKPVPWAVIVGGNIQTVLVIVTVALVYLGHRRAPAAAVGIGLLSAGGFSVAHLLPTWGGGFFSDSFVTPVAGSGVTWFSWVTVFSEIGTALIFAYVGYRTHSAGSSRAVAMAATPSPRPVSPSPSDVVPETLTGPPTASDSTR